MRPVATLRAATGRVDRTARQLAALASVTRTARRVHGAGALATVRRAREVRRRGFEYPEALRMGLLDPAMPDHERQGFVSRHENTATQRLLNGEDSPPLVSDKIAFGLYCRALGIAAPELLAIVHAQGDGWSRPATVLRTRDDWIAAVSAFPPEFVVKPSAGHGGAGVRVLVRSGGTLTGPGGDRTTVGGLWDALRADPQFTSFIVQERLRNHPEIAELGGGDETLHTLRIVTLVRRDGGAEVAWAGLKLGLGGTGVDNIQKGTTGNESRTVGDDGTIGARVVPRPDGCGWILADEPGPPRRLPMWDEARDLACSAALHFPSMRTLGWDIALTPDGPSVIEANAHWGVEETSRMAAVFERLRTA